MDNRKKLTFKLTQYLITVTEIFIEQESKENKLQLGEVLDSVIGAHMNSLFGAIRCISKEDAQSHADVNKMIKKIEDALSFDTQAVKMSEYKKSKH